MTQTSPVWDGTERRISASGPKCLAAYTAADPLYPPYVSINYVGTMVEITVRSPAKADGSCGDVAVIKMNIFNFRKTMREALGAIP